MESDRGTVKVSSALSWGQRGSRKTFREQAYLNQNVHGEQFSRQVPEGKDAVGTQRMQQMQKELTGTT